MPTAACSVLTGRTLPVLSWVGLGAALLTASCGSGSTETGILINLANVPNRTSRIAVKTTLDGKPGTPDTSEFPASGLTRFGVTVPATSTGALNIDLTIYDADRCIQGNTTVMASLPAARGTQVTASISAQSPRKCEPLLPCADRTLCTQTKTQANRLWSAWALSNTDVWAVGDSSTVLHWDGKTWTPNNTGIPAGIALSGVWASAPDDVWAVGGNAAVTAGYIYHFDGTRWTQNYTGSRYLNWIHGTSKADIFVVGVSNSGATLPGDFRRYNPSTNTWDFISSGVNKDFFAVWANTPTDVWVAGGVGTFLRYNGTSVLSIPIGATNDLHAVHGYVTQSGQTIVYASGLGGIVLRYDGTSTPRLNTAGTQLLNSVLATPEAVYVASSLGTVYKSEGVTDIFTSFSSGSDTLYAISLAPNGIGWIVGGGGFLGYIDTRP
ncbi:MAG TPA: hypothetical protein PKI03_31265 [Pseudomonadota bacterium]|nr:hypothetical protein [Pseudomonadota bacterium]